LALSAAALVEVTALPPVPTVLPLSIAELVLSSACVLLAHRCCSTAELQYEIPVSLGNVALVARTGCSRVTTLHR
jgi:hypothetical protein